MEVPACPGGSGRINAAGGTIAGSMGVDPNEYLPAAKLGVTKVNIDTDGRLVWTRVHREFFRDKPAEFDFRPPARSSSRNTPSSSPAAINCSLGRTACLGASRPEMK